MVIVRTFILVMMMTSMLDLYFIKRLTNKLQVSENKLPLTLKKVLVVVCSVFILLTNPYILPVVMFVFGLMILGIKKGKRLKNQRAIEYYGYKIFKFIINQISSGILVSDAIQSMYLVVDNVILRHCLIKVSAYYAQTTDLDHALKILRESYKGIEVDTLCVAIEQGIQTGGQYETMLKMEELLFKKYINQIKRETELRKKRGVLAVLLLSTVIILMIAVPLLLDMLTAFNQIFY